jgi:hypothetical protein
VADVRPASGGPTPGAPEARTLCACFTGAEDGARFNAELADLILEDASVPSWLHPGRVTC